MMIDNDDFDDDDDDDDYDGYNIQSRHIEFCKADRNTYLRIRGQLSPSGTLMSRKESIEWSNHEMYSISDL